MKQTKLLLVIFAFLLFTSNLWSQVRLVVVDNEIGVIMIANVSDNTVDISQHRLCFLFTYPVISDLQIDFGDPSNILPGGFIALSGVPIDANASDLAIYLPTGAFTDPDNMIDFMQYGSSGNGRESVAVEKGIWDAGTFVEGGGPYFFNGNPMTDFGAEFWFSDPPTGVNEIELANEINVYPNPSVDELNIISEESIIESYKIVNMLGEIVFEQSTIIPQKSIRLNLSSLNRGNYILYLNTSNGIATKKITLIK